MHKYFNYLLLSTFIFFCFYIIEITDVLISYEIFIDILLIPIFISIAVFFVLTILQSIKEKKLPKRLQLLIVLSLICSFTLLYKYRNGAFFGTKYLAGSFLDERSRIDIFLYKNGKYIIFSNWLFGEVRFEGNYKVKNDTISFEKFPVIENDFISQKVIINKAEKKIYFRKNKDGNYNKDFYYFKIEK